MRRALLLASRGEGGGSVGGVVVTPPSGGADVADEFDTLAAGWVNQYPPGDHGYGDDSDFDDGLADQVTVSGGELVISAERTGGLPEGRTFKSASITNADFAAKYGTWEARIWYPKGQGYWPAFWFTLASDITHSPPELDVFEAYPGTGLTPSHGSSGSGVAVTTFHSELPDHLSLTYDAGADLTTGFHVWRVEWPDSSHLRTYVDGVLLKEWTANLPTAPIQPIFSLALGANHVYNVDDGSTTPDKQMRISYLRYYAP